MTDPQPNPNALSPLGSTRLVELNGRLYQVHILPAQPLAPQPIAHPNQYPAPIQQPPQSSAPIQPPETWAEVLEKRGVWEQLNLLLWIAVGGLSIALVMAVIRVLTPQPMAPQANPLDPAISTLLQQQKQVAEDLRSQNAQLFQQLQAKPTYERQCTPGFLGIPVCSEIRRGS